jgi:hypothetical protein
MKGRGLRMAGVVEFRSANGAWRTPSQEILLPDAIRAGLRAHVRVTRQGGRTLTAVDVDDNLQGLTTWPIVDLVEGRLCCT